MLVNVVSSVPPAIWEREWPPGLQHNYLHTAVPTQAEYHIIYGIRKVPRVPNSRNRIALVASGPHENIGRDSQKPAEQNAGHVRGLYETQDASVAELDSVAGRPRM